MVVNHSHLARGAARCPYSTQCRSSVVDAELGSKKGRLSRIGLVAAAATTTDPCRATVGRFSWSASRGDQGGLKAGVASGGRARRFRRRHLRSRGQRVSGGVRR